MNVGVEPQLVVTDRKTRFLAAETEDARGLFAELQRQTFFQFDRIHRVAEIEVDYRLLQRRVDRILIELRVGNPGHEARRHEAEFVAVEQGLRRDQRLADDHRVLDANRPVFLRLEFELLVGKPAPYAGQCWRNADAGSHFLVDGGQRGDRSREGNAQRLRLGIVLDGGAFEGGNLEADGDRFRPCLPPLVAPVAAATDDAGHQQCCQCDARSRPHLSPCGEQPVATAVQPGRRLPAQVPEQRLAQGGKQADDDSRQPRGFGQQTHGVSP